MKDLFIVTHAESVHHLEGRVGGWYDTGLTARGQRDAEATAERLAALVGSRDVEIFSSDLLRASETAAAVSRRLLQPVTETAALREISYGVAGGKPQAWLDARYVPAPDDNRLDHDCGIEGAETRRDVAARVFPCVDAIAERPCETQIIVTHGFTLTLVIAAWMKVPIEATGFLSFPAKSGSITHLRQDDFFRNRAIVTLADASHLTIEAP
ncbi:MULTISPECIES: histidine phosphatase family protein [unclassified Ensifer]|uniref:histidine phosphatase family protein n=1 Tax=unclassified Ensifer TaxID=2633371 RepID=UPI000812EDBA|nr:MULTISPECIES: histidine phosphatase family protein [unclassified Ensifer]OCP01738.1 phosphoglycerate kinase [Ensifer sp. LC14]OCP09527.1 phosphoglycerate kinase [Ensifer sp. LC13]OCP10697.1 phosphoglycerate kinase [Ensifer sp. LC11]OCP32775.1 phosphoglycerate kinase [Ensifer sp. LC499]